MTHAMRAAAVLAALLLVASGCGSDDSKSDGADEPDLDPSSDTTTAPVDDETAIKETIAAYDKALVTLNKEQDLTPALDDAATDEWARELVTTYDDNLFSRHLVMTGRWHTIVDSVAVDGDSAEAEVCNDGTRVYVIDRGGEIENGSASQGRTRGVLRLVREADGWQVDGNTNEEGSC